MRHIHSRRRGQKLSRVESLDWSLKYRGGGGESSCIKVAFSIIHKADPIVFLPGVLAALEVNFHLVYYI